MVWYGCCKGVLILEVLNRDVQLYASKGLPLMLLIALLWYKECSKFIYTSVDCREIKHF